MSRTCFSNPLRRAIGGGFIQEVMSTPPGAKDSTFGNRAA
jgi:hypothetical protein